MMADPRAEPRYGERVPYLVSYPSIKALGCFVSDTNTPQVIYGQPGARLIDLVVSPLEYMENMRSYRINGTYYITKQVTLCAGMFLFRLQSSTLFPYSSFQRCLES